MKITPSGCIHFGKHKGEALSSPEVPTDYLRWVQENVDLEDEEEELLLAELAHRDNPGNQQRFTGTGFDSTKFRPGPTPKAPRLVSPDAALKVVSAGRRALAKTHHPDAGGDPAQMVEINAAADYLESVARTIAP